MLPKGIRDGLRTFTVNFAANAEAVETGVFIPDGDG